MSFSSDNEVALPVLRKYDPQCQNIIDSCNKVKIHNFDKAKNSWVIQDQLEGALYLVKRAISPLYKFVILSRYNKPGTYPLTTDITISQYYISQSHHQYYMFKNDSGVIQAIMFPSTVDCDRISSRVEKIIKELKFASEKVSTHSQVTPRSNFPDTLSGTPKTSSKLTGDDGKIINLLEQARQRYESHSDTATVATSTPDRRSRQIDINELFTSTNNGIAISAPARNTTMVNMSSSYTAKTSVCRSVSQDTKDDNGTAPTLTVTELEKFFAQGALRDKDSSILDDRDDDDDFQLLNPTMLMATSGQSSKSGHDDGLLSKEQLREAMIELLQSEDDGGLFLTRLHAAYADICRKAARK